MSSKSCPLAIVGMSCLFPKADDLQSYWANIKNGVDAITPIPLRSHWNAADYFDPDPKSPDHTYAQRGGFLSPVDFNPMEFGIAPKDIEATDTTQLLSLVAAQRALADAGYAAGPAPGREFNRERTSVILGVTGALELVIPLGARLGHPHWRKALKDAGVEADVAEDVVQRISDSYVGWQENSFPGLLGNVAAGRIANRLDVGGTNCVVDAACASSLAAIHLASLELSAGLSDMVITGGVDTFNDIFMYMCFSKTPALSPTGDSKPFDRDCDGTVLGEGLGILVIKRLADAERDGDRIYAVLKGMGSSSDGRSTAIYAPRAGGQKIAVQRAYEAAGVTPETLGLVEAHGTGTKVGDATELSSLTEVFRSGDGKDAWCALGSVKSQIGHTKAAAGVAGIIKAAMALHHKVLPPTIKVKQPLDGAAPGKSPFYVNTSKRPWLPNVDHPRRAGVSALGFGGTNFHCVLEETASAKPAIDWDGDVEILAISADTVEGLKLKLNEIRAAGSWLDFRRTAYASRSQFQSSAATRMLLVVTSASDRAALIDSALAMLDKQAGKSAWTTPTGIAFGSGAVRGKIGGLFPGQGSQYVGMFRDLACQFPAMLDTLAQADAAQLADPVRKAGPRLSDVIYPHPAFSDEARAQQEATLKATEMAQPAIGAVSLGALQILASFGVSLEAGCGHSYGELMALCSAGRITPDALHTLSGIRGQLMSSKAGSADRGTMLAVQADEEAVKDLLGAGTDAVVVANRNSPRQTVLAGSVTQIHKVADALNQRSIRSRVLSVSAAFHSPLVADARAPFAQALQNVAIGTGSLPVYANSTGLPYPQTEAEARDMLANQMVRPVNFMQQIRAMHADGVRTFVEIGPGHVLSDLVQAILPTGDADAIALDASKGARSGTFDLAWTLCRLAAIGHRVDLAKWERPPAPMESRGGKPALTVPISGANHRLPQKARPPVQPKPAMARMASSVIEQAPTRVTPPNTATAAAPAASLPKTGVSMPDDLPAALRAAQEGILALQRLQEQTAQLHKQFLEGQESARQAIQSLLALRTDAPVPAAAPLRTEAVSVATPATQRPVPEATGQGPASVVAPAAAPVVRSAQAAIAPQVSNRSVCERAVIEVVSDKTGYPAEMLNLDMGMDADLGIDSIKRVEIMAALRARLPQAPEIKPEHLGSLQTLEQVVAFLSVGMPATLQPSPAVASAPTVNAASTATASVLLEVVSEKTGYPVEMLDLGMGLDADLGIDSIKRVEIMAALRAKLPHAPEIKPEHLGSLQTLQHIVEFLGQGANPAPPQASASADNGRIKDVLLSVVSDKTGYPVEMLSLDMGLDADLGIDSIKRVEIMAALRSALPGSPEIKPEHLGSLQTLAQIVEFLGAGSAAAETLAAPAASDDRISEVLLEVVSEKTGYPVEMLNLDMGLDADLGIDSIKRVEIMAALRSELPASPEIKPEHLGALQSLRQIVAFLQAGAAPVVQAAAPTAPAANIITAAVPLPEAGSADDVMRQLVRPMAIARDELRSVLTLPHGAHVWLIADTSELSSRVDAALRAKRLVVHAADAQKAALESKTWPTPSAVVILAPAQGADQTYLKRVFMQIQAAAPGLRKAGASGVALLVTVSRLDGAFGFGNMGDHSDPVSGGLAGIVKTARLEWPEVRCKAIDLDPLAKVSDVVDGLIEELFLDGPVEVGISAQARVTLEIELESSAVEPGALPLTDGDVVVVSGGARGVTGDAALALSRRFRGTLVLLGRNALEEAEAAWSQGLTSDAELKKALFARLPAGTTPAAVDAQAKQIVAQREIRAQLARIQAVGAKAAYLSVDVRDAAAVAKAMTQVRVQHGAIRGLIHGAGVLADRRIEDKTDAQFDAVYGTKVEGLQHLLAALNGDALKVLGLFSSYTGRFGRVGQVDYAAANEVLNKMAQAESRRRPGCRVVSVNWGPWNGGMVTPGLRKVFEQEGVGLIEPDAGAAFFVRELCMTGSSPVEVLALAPSPQLVASAAVPRATEPLALTLAGAHVAFEREVSVAALPFLESHVINGRAVLPAALMLEWLAQAALHGNPGMRFHGLDDFKVLKGVVLDAGESVTVSLMAGTGKPRDALHVVPVRMVSQSGGRQVLHAQADVLLTEEKLPKAPAADVVDISGGAIADAYSLGVLFHGAALHGIERVEVCAEQGVAALLKAASAPIKWMRNPLRGTWIADPLALDSAFQMMILWSAAHRGGPSLPSALGRYRQFVAAFPKGGCRAVIGVALGISAIAVASIQFLDRQGNLLASAEGCEFVVDAALRDAFRLNRLKLDQ